MVGWSTITTIYATNAAFLYALCASVFATAGWNAPVCIASGTIASLSTILALCASAHNLYSTVKSKNPDRRPHVMIADMPHIEHIKLHNGSHTQPGIPLTMLGWIQLPFNETFNITHTRYNTHHTITKVSETVVHVGTEFNRDAEDTFNTLNNRRGTKQQDTYNKLVLAAQWHGRDHGEFPSYADGEAMGKQIANKITRLGKYCTTLNGPNEAGYISIGLTAQSPAYEPLVQPPCYAS